jgi:hypothetical protein
VPVGRVWRHQPGDLDLGRQADGRDSDHHAAPTVGGDLSGLTERLGRADRLERHVHAGSAGQVTRGGYGVVLGRVDRCVEPAPASPRL